MALNDIERKRCEKVLSGYIERIRPDPSIREKLDISFRISGQSVEVFEIRPVFRAPAKKVELPVAKATYVRSQNIWKIFWRRADLKWHSYTPVPTVKSINDFVKIVERDEHACFWG